MNSRLGSTGRAWLKGFHVCFTGAWVGAAICLILLQFVSRPTGGDELYAVLATLKLIDDFVIIPAAIGSLLTGFLISWLTPWGFFKFRWVTVKWVVTVALILLGTFALGPWLNGMEAIAASERIQALQNQTFLSNRQFLAISAWPQFAALLALVFISVIKPWKKQKR